MEPQLSLITEVPVETSAVGRLTERTRRAYERDVAAFAAYCREKNASAVPARDQILADYLTELGAHHKVATVERAMYAIRNAHVVAGHPSPTTGQATRDAWRTVLQRAEDEGERALLVLSRGISEAVVTIDDSAVGRRDRALITSNFFGSLSRGELSWARRENLVFAQGRAFLAVNRSERQHASRVVAIDSEPNPEVCPVRALERWTEVAGYEHGPLFARITDGGHVVPEFLSDRTIARIINRRLEKIGLAHGRSVSAAGLRNGVVVEQLGRGMSVNEAAIRYGRVALRHVHRLQAIARSADLSHAAL